MSTKLTFEQREGIAPLPAQLELRTISQELRAVLWKIVHDDIHVYSTRVSGTWDGILQRKHVFRDFKMIDTYSSYWRDVREQLRSLFESGTYAEVLGFLEFVMRDREAPHRFADRVAWALEYARSAYRVVDGDTIAPVSTEAEAAALSRAIADARTSSFEGAHAHLRAAASYATAAKWSESVRESIHAVESVAVMLGSGGKTLAPALAGLSKKIEIHPALKDGFGKLYGFTSDENGIRHALLDKAGASVDETDALYMLATCAAFVSYLIGKGRVAGLLARRSCAHSTTCSPPRRPWQSSGQSGRRSTETCRHSRRLSRLLRPDLRHGW